MRVLKNLSLTLAIAAALSGITGQALAATPAQPNATAASTAVISDATVTAEKAVAQQVLLLTRAMIVADSDQLQALTSAALSYGHSSGKVENQAQFVDQIASKRSDFVSIELKNQTITLSGQTAIVRHEMIAATNDGGVPNNIHIGIMLVWQLEADGWKLLARQAFRLPN